MPQASSKNFRDALHGPVAVAQQVDAWYDGELIYENVPILSGAVTFDSTRAIVGSASIVAGSSDGSLAPTRWDSPLACYGSELHVRAGIVIPGGGTEMFSLGWYRIDSFDSQEWWRPYATPDGAQIWTPQGVQVSNEASDRMSTLSDARFLAPTAPTSLASVLAEIRLLCRGIVDVEDFTSIADAAIPKSITYEDSRVDAIQALAGVLGMTASMSPNGALQLTSSQASGPAVWAVSVADDEAARLLSWSRKGDRAGLYNAVVTTGTNAAGNPIQGVAQENNGPLRFGGPFGQVPYARNNPLLTTDIAATRDASTTLARVAGDQAVVIPVTCPPNAALLLGDVIDVVLPDRTLTGPVQTMTFNLPLSTLSLGVAVPRSSLWGDA